ncbi:MAG TPA: hypothetical protein VEJ63_13595 [Planctomycetota bacterium]|nr:hypothetical protein [Planctomycetota bacterium]
MSFVGLKRIKVTAPVVVVLATVVNAAAPCAYATSEAPAAPDLSWAVRGTHQARTTRVLLARKAASDIRSADRINVLSSSKPEAPAFGAVPEFESVVPAYQHVRSSHQHSAP